MIKEHGCQKRKAQVSFLETWFAAVQVCYAACVIFGHPFPVAISLLDLRALLSSMWAIEVDLICSCVYSSLVLPLEPAISGTTLAKSPGWKAGRLELDRMLR